MKRRERLKEQLHKVTPFYTIRPPGFCADSTCFCVFSVGPGVSGERLTDSPPRSKVTGSVGTGNNHLYKPADEVLSNIIVVIYRISERSAVFLYSVLLLLSSRLLSSGRSAKPRLTFVRSRRHRTPSGRAGWLPATVWTRSDHVRSSSVF